MTLLLPLLLALAGFSALFLGAGSMRAALLGTPPRQETTVVGTGFPKRLVDPIGITQTLSTPPRRIVSAILAGDQMLAALVAFDRLAGVTYLVDEPGISNIAGVVPPSIPRIQANIEPIIALQPDLVVVAGYTRAVTVRLLAAAGIPVLRFNWYNAFEQVMHNVRTIGDVVGSEARAARMIEDMQARIAAVEQRVHGRVRPRVLYVAPGGYSSGRDTLIDEMITRAGGDNVAREAGLKGPSRLPLEIAISLAPDVIIVGDWSATPGQTAVQALYNDPVWQQVPAVINGRVYAIRGAWLTSVSQYAVYGLEAIARLLHPEAFTL